MRAIIIGAGRGIRLMPTTLDSPKCFAEVGGRRVLDWAVEAFGVNGIDEIVFIGGYQIDKVRRNYPQFTFRHNDQWEQNNILASLFYAEDLMNDPFVCAYSDILFRPSVIASMLECNEDMALSVDTRWLDRYGSRTEHPSDDAEKVTVENGRVTCVDRKIPESERLWRIHRNRQVLRGRVAAIARPLPSLSAAIRRPGVPRRPDLRKGVFHPTPPGHDRSGSSPGARRYRGGYIEVDTQQDFEFASKHWGPELRPV